MPVLFSVRNLSHAFGARPLFEGVSFTLSDGDRVGLIGPNGAGKSTLLKIVAGAIAPDRGEVARRGGLRCAYLEQVTELDFPTVRAAVRDRLPTGEHAHENEGLVDEWINRLELDAEAPLAGLSGGWLKRVALARAFVGDPELLLLDEPTNHLDVESILWLERFLANARCATLTVTHDRLFLQRVSRRILELDRRNPGGLLDVAGDYATYTELKGELMSAQEQREQALKNTLRRETEWLRRGPSARSTKQVARIDRAGSLAAEVAELRERNRSNKLELDFQARDPDEMRPKRLIEARGISKRYGDKRVLAELDLLIGPRTRLGLIGGNGCGKSTLLRILTGDEAPTLGEVFRADYLKVAYFEQDRASLDPKRTVAQTVSPDGDFVHFRGSHVHRHGYLERFAFRPEQMAQPVGSLSGGEQSRLLIARLMLEPANLLVLDEPTNDLDLVTLNVLEEALKSFEGAVLLVTHDRYFLDQVATELLAFHTRADEAGRVTMLADLAQWEAFHTAQSNERERSERGVKADVPRGNDAAPKKKKLSFKDQRDYDSIEGRILESEAKVAEIEGEMARPEVVSDGARLVELDRALGAARADVERLYARWSELEALRSEG
ncbi:MAG TPA: ABC-F family ATP-binding cassette domain-containing protein [Polyangiaceae bacterium]|nr:ABC-F family ATP-binding cassette domain-containing protein [Polyangiaceae bacterium]